MSNDFGICKLGLFYPLTQDAGSSPSGWEIVLGYPEVTRLIPHATCILGGGVEPANLKVGMHVSP